MGTASRTVRRSSLVMVMSLVAFVAGSCVPPTDPGPAPLRAVLTPTAGPAGTFIAVAPPNGDCLRPGGYTGNSLEAALVHPATGYVVNRGFTYFYNGPSLSPGAAPDPFVRLWVPPSTAVGEYYVYLTCYNYLASYAYAPAIFTVTLF